MFEIDLDRVGSQFLQTDVDHDSAGSDLTAARAEASHTCLENVRGRRMLTRVGQNRREHLGLSALANERAVRLTEHESD